MSAAGIVWCALTLALILWLLFWPPPPNKPLPVG